MSDYVVLQKEAARVYLGGPPLVKMAIDEDANDEDLGGAEMHARVSGLADYLAEDEPDALRIGREIVGHLRWRKQGSGPDRAAGPARVRPEELLGIASADVRVPFEAREVLARVLDGSEFEEFKPLYGTTLVTGWGHLGGYPVGVLANNGDPVQRGEPRRAPSSSSCATGTTSPSCSSRTSPASWSAPSTSRAASSRTAPS